MRCDLPPGADIVDLVRGGDAGSLVIVIAPGRCPLSLAQARAAIGPLAIEQAPARRINAIIVENGADGAAVDAMAAFLDSASSTTGQIVTVS